MTIPIELSAKLIVSKYQAGRPSGSQLGPSCRRRSQFMPTKCPGSMISSILISVFDLGSSEDTGDTTHSL